MASVLLLGCHYGIRLHFTKPRFADCSLRAPGLSLYFQLLASGRMCHP